MVFFFEAPSYGQTIDRQLYGGRFWEEEGRAEGIRLERVKKKEQIKSAEWNWMQGVFRVVI